MSRSDEPENRGLMVRDAGLRPAPHHEGCLSISPHPEERAQRASRRIEATGPERQMTPGEIIPKSGTLTLNAGRATVTLTVANSGDRPIQVGSHYHFFETNPALKFDR